MDNLERIEETLAIDAGRAGEKITNFIENIVANAEAEGVVLGLSGGLDSSTTASLCVGALGKDNVFGVFMPEEGVTKPKNAKDSEKIAEILGIRLEKVSISPIFEKMKDEIGLHWGGKVPDANMKARIRMVILYHYANLLDYLVAGAGNKSELRCGYFTKFGDGAADLRPLGSLYKTQVKEVAKEIGIPSEIIDKPPSAGLWKGQKDEEELGLTYDKIDRIYVGLEIGLSENEIAKAIDVSKSEVQKFKDLEKKSRHKLRQPPVPDL